MTKLKRLLATIGLLTILVLPGNISSSARALDDTRFMGSKETIGKTLEEVRKEIGEPDEKGPCAMVAPVEDKIVTIPGEGWDYQYIFPNGSYRLSICFIQGLSAAELTASAQIGENMRSRIITREIIDHKLLRNIIDGQPDRPEWLDLEGPEI